MTALLRAWTRGDPRAIEQLLPVLYQELHRTAHAYMRRERSGHILQTTAVINEVFLRLIDINQIEWRDRSHFLTTAAHLMRRILVDHGRRRASLKRGGPNNVAAHLDESLVVSPSRTPQLVALDDALNSLARHDDRKAKVVELRFFGGLSVEETAAALDISPQTVMRDWSLAKAWLRREMT